MVLLSRLLLLAFCITLVAQDIFQGPLITMSSSTPAFSNIDCGTPPVSSNLVQWLCAKNFATLGYTNQQPVTNWIDISPQLTNSLYYTNLWDNSKPVWISNTINGLPAVAFHLVGVRSFPALANSNKWWTGVTQAQVFYVMNVASKASAGGVMGYETIGTAGVNDLLWDSVAPADVPKLAWGTTARKTLTNNMTAGGNWILSMWTGSNDWGAMSNDVTIFTTNANTVGFPATAGAAIIGYSAPSGYGFVGSYAEVLVYTNKLSTSDCTAVNNWLKTKYGL